MTVWSTVNRSIGSMVRLVLGGRRAIRRHERGQGTELVTKLCMNIVPLACQPVNKKMVDFDGTATVVVPQGGIFQGENIFRRGRIPRMPPCFWMAPRENTGPGASIGYFVSNQVPPTPVSTSSGTERVRAVDISSRTRDCNSSVCSAGVSRTSSSWICRSRRAGQSRAFKRS